MEIVRRAEIERVLPELDLLPAIEAGFAAYSAGAAVVPPVAELLLDKGEVHIKCGYLRDEELYVVKVASGFYDNPSLGLPSSDGLMLLFRQETGELAAVLLDEGRLTDVRTAVAGAIAAKHLAPSRVARIGVVGTGTQARLQLLHLQGVTSCRRVIVWGRGDAQLGRYRDELAAAGFEVATTRDAGGVLASTDLVVTTTPAAAPLLHAAHLRPGTHITAVGSDTPDKQELEAAILARADRVVADSLAQCRLRGEIHQALAAGAIDDGKPVELGRVIAGDVPGRTADDQITVADLTGVAVQDMKMAEAVYRAVTGVT